MKTRFGKVLAAVAIIIFAGIWYGDIGGAHFWNSDKTAGIGASSLYAESIVTMRQAGTLSTLLKNTDKELKI